MGHGGTLTVRRVATFLLKLVAKVLPLKAGKRKITLSTVFAGQNVGIKEVSDKVWLVSFMQYDLGFFDQETGWITSTENPFGAKVLPMCPE
jgi:hypothetical protein